jgi:hypothetical protein
MFTRACLLLLLSLSLLACEDKAKTKATGTNNTNATSASSATATTAAKTTPTSASESAPYAIKPGEGIGPVRLGMSRDEVSELGLEVKPHPSGQMGEDVQMVGGIYTVFKDEKVSMVEVSAEINATINDKPIPTDASLEQAKAMFEGCGELEILLGGNVIKCDKNVRLKQGGHDPKIAIDISVSAE